MKTQVMIVPAMNGEDFEKARPWYHIGIVSKKRSNILWQSEGKWPNRHYLAQK